jgi:hypothetical protein
MDFERAIVTARTWPWMLWPFAPPGEAPTRHDRQVYRICELLREFLSKPRPIVLRDDDVLHGVLATDRYARDTPDNRER